MKALLIINQGKEKNIKVIVKLKKQALIERINRLTKQENEKEAFNLLIKNAEVERYIPPGEEIDLTPELKLIKGVL